jgi:predicted DNA-binding ArsR family transcriptional regulator
MITPEFHKKQINKVKRSYENILIDIMFSLVDIEDIIETQSFPIEDIEKKIDELKRNIGKSLED